MLGLSSICTDSDSEIKEELPESSSDNKQESFIPQINPNRNVKCLNISTGQELGSSKDEKLPPINLSSDGTKKENGVKRRRRLSK